MDEETKQFLSNLVEHAFQDQHQKLSLGFKKVYDDIGELKNQVGINCKKLDDMNDILHDVKTTVNSISEIVTANGQGIEVLSERLNKLE